MPKSSRKKLDYIANYDSNNYDRVLVRLPLGSKSAIQSTGSSVNGFIVQAVRERLEQLDTNINPDCNLSPATLQRVSAAVKAGCADSVAHYISRAVNLQLERDRQLEIDRRKHLHDTND